MYRVLTCNYQTWSPRVWCNIHMIQTLELYNQTSFLTSHTTITPTVSCTWIPHGTHSNLEVTDVSAARGDDATQQQRNPLRRQLNPPIIKPHVQGNCHRCGRCYNDVDPDAPAAYTAATEYPGETVRDRNIRSRAYSDRFEAAHICFKKAGLSQPTACVWSVVQR